MKTRWSILGSIAVLGTLMVTADAMAQSTVSYGRITAVRQVNIDNPGAQTAGTLVGGALGVASGSGQSRSNRALYCDRCAPVMARRRVRERVRRYRGIR